jgi:membrane-associated phospholipid phosphatase
MNHPTATPQAPLHLRPINRWLWLLPLVLLLIGIPVWQHHWEPDLFLTLNHASQVLPAVVWTNLSLLGNGWAVLALTAPLLVLAPRLFWAWVCSAPFAILLARGLKPWLDDPRPAALIEHSRMVIVGEPLYHVAMPSGHTLTAFAVIAGIYFALPAARRLRHAWLWLLAIGAGWSRMAVGAHWPADVWVGACLGLWCGLLGQLLLARVPAHWQQPQAWGLRIAAALVALAVFHLIHDELDFALNRPLQYVLAVVAIVSLAAFIRRSFFKPSQPDSLV